MSGTLRFSTTERLLGEVCRRSRAIRIVTTMVATIMASAVLLQTTAVRAGAQAMKVAGISDTAMVAAALNHMLNRSPGRVMYLDPRRLNWEQRPGVTQWLNDWEAETIRALRLDYRLIAGTVMTNGAQSCQPSQAVSISQPPALPARVAAVLKPNDSPMMGNTQPTTLYVGISAPLVAEDTARVLVSACENGRSAQRALTMIRTPKKWKIVTDEVQKRN